MSRTLAERVGVGRRSLVATAYSVQVDVALHKPLSDRRGPRPGHRRARKRGHRDPLLLLRLTGRGLVLPGAHRAVVRNGSLVASMALNPVVFTEKVLQSFLRYQLRATTTARQNINLSLPNSAPASTTGSSPNQRKKLAVKSTSTLATSSASTTTAGC